MYLQVKIQRDFNEKKIEPKHFKLVTKFFLFKTGLFSGLFKNSDDYQPELTEILFKNIKSYDKPVFFNEFI